MDRFFFQGIDPLALFPVERREILIKNDKDFRIAIKLQIQIADSSVKALDWITASRRACKRSQNRVVKLFDDGDQNVAFAGEVVVNQTNTGTCRLCDFRHGRLMIALTT